MLYKSISAFLSIMVLGTSVAIASFNGKYCELVGATTDSGESVTGQCYFYSDRYGELEGAATASGESVTGECYRYSERYAELESASTDEGENVTGECYIH